MNASMLSNKSGFVVRLVAESLAEPHSAGSVRAILELPRSAVCLHLAGTGAPLLSTTPPLSGEPCVTLEPILLPRRQPRVLLIASSPGQVTVNDRRAGRLTVLSEKDQFRAGDSPLFHVTLFSHPQIGPPSADLLGKECPVCRVPFSQETTCYRCSCNSAFHAEGDEPDDNRLQCVRAVSACPSCGLPIVLAAAYSWFPSEVPHV